MVTSANRDRTNKRHDTQLPFPTPTLTPFQGSAALAAVSKLFSEHQPDPARLPAGYQAPPSEHAQSHSLPQALLTLTRRPQVLPPAHANQAETTRPTPPSHGSPTNPVNTPRTLHALVRCKLPPPWCGVSQSGSWRSSPTMTYTALQGTAGATWQSDPSLLRSCPVVPRSAVNKTHRLRRISAPACPVSRALHPRAQQGSFCG